jgi:multidrug efflux pump subunit AcrA (membrane-fusion protein)
MPWGLLLTVAVLLVALMVRSAGKRSSARLLGVEAPSSAPATTTGGLRLKGTTQAVETRAILAPVLAGEQVSSLTILSLRGAGSKVRQGDLLVEFDRQAQLRDFIDKQAQSDKMAGDVLQEQAKEDAARAKDEAEIQTARDSLERAALEMQKVELMSRIDAEKAREDLDEAKATLEQLQQTFDLKRKAARASVRILEIQRDRARETMLHSQENAALMQVRSPIDGIVVLNTIWKQGSMGEVQEGDQVRPGVPFMQVVDPSAMEVEVSVNQQDVLALHDGEKARIHLEAYPDLVCPGELKVMDPMGKAGAFSAKVRVFSALFSVDCLDARLLPGLTAAVDVLPSAVEGVSGAGR